MARVAPEKTCPRPAKAPLGRYMKGQSWLKKSSLMVIKYHINGDTMDNRRSNLRIATARQNNLNARKISARKTESRFKGVSWNVGKWVARIRTENGHLTLGRFTNEVEAAFAYDHASMKYHAEYGSRNFLPLVIDA